MAIPPLPPAKGPSSTFVRMGGLTYTIIINPSTRPSKITATSSDDHTVITSTPCSTAHATGDREHHHHHRLVIQASKTGQLGYLISGPQLWLCRAAASAPLDS